jgi:hypothetical protein
MSESKADVEVYGLFLLGGCLQGEHRVGASEKGAEFEHLVCTYLELKCKDRVMKGWGLNLKNFGEISSIYIL